MKKPPFLFVPGAAKSGTSTLHVMLNQHPDIFMSRFKEPGFFAAEEAKWGRVGYAEGIDKYLDEYFEEGWDYEVMGESSTAYFYHPKSFQRINKHFPKSKFILCLRNPIERFLSHYNWLFHLKSENRSISEILKQHDSGAPEIIKHDDFFRGNAYVRGGKYGTLYQEMLKYVAPERIHIITFTALVKKPKQTINSCFRFLGLQEMDHVKLVKDNASGEQRYPFINNMAMRMWYGLPMLKQREKLLENPTFKKMRNFVFAVKPTDKIELSFKQRKRLQEIYSPEVSLLRKLTGRNFEEWYDDFPLKNTPPKDSPLLA